MFVLTLPFKSAPAAYGKPNQWSLYTTLVTIQLTMLVKVQLTMLVRVHSSLFVEALKKVIAQLRFLSLTFSL